MHGERDSLTTQIQSINQSINFSLFISMSVYMYLFVPIYVCSDLHHLICSSLSQFIHLCRSLFISTYLSITVSLFPSIYLSIYLSTSAHTYLHQLISQSDRKDEKKNKKKTVSVLSFVLLSQIFQNKRLLHLYILKSSKFKMLTITKS